VTHTHTHTHTHTISRTSLVQESACRRKIYRTKHNIRKRQTLTPPAGYEPTVPASEQSQIHSLEPNATKIEVTQTQSRNIPIYMEFTDDAYECRLTSYCAVVAFKKKVGVNKESVNKKGYSHQECRFSINRTQLPKCR